MKEKESKIGEETKFSWFWRWFLNNKVVTALLITLLILLIILVFTKVSYLFHPLGQFIAIVGAPILVAGLLFYFLNPLVNWFERKGMKRVWAIALIFVIVLALIIWGIVILIPKIKSQTMSFVRNWPNYWDTIEKNVVALLNHPFFDKYIEQIQQVSDKLFESIGNLVKNIPKRTFKGIGNIVGAVANVVITIVTTPFILFYLLKDGKDLADYAIKFLPTKARKPTKDVLIDINEQVSSYIRGQLTVAFAVALMFILGFSIIGLDYSVTLGILAGFLNLIPYIGSALATIPAVLLALVAGPVMLVKVIIVFVIEQLIEGRIISPLVLGSQMKIHPVTIIFVLLTAGKLFGVLGVVLGIPGYAAIKVLITHIYEWYRSVSSLYAEDRIAEQQQSENE